VRQGGAVPVEFTTIAVSDGISMGHEGMRASLVSREVIADSVETVVFAERLDGTVTLAGTTNPARMSRSRQPSRGASTVNTIAS